MALDLSMRTTADGVLDLSCKSPECRVNSSGAGQDPRAVRFQLPHPQPTYCMLRKQRYDRKRKQSVEDSSGSSSEESDSPPAKRLHDSEELKHSSIKCGGDTATSTTPLPRDPRDWSRLDVCRWLREMRRYHTDVLCDLEEERFPTNGKGLCLMSAAMFSWRVPRGGAVLYRDFRLRLHRALARVPSKA